MPLQLIEEETGPKLERLKKERDSFIEYQKIVREIEHLNKLYVAWQVCISMVVLLHGCSNVTVLLECCEMVSIYILTILQDSMSIGHEGISTKGVAMAE